jgi:hypothetical protein
LLPCGAYYIRKHGKSHRNNGMHFKLVHRFFFLRIKWDKFIEVEPLGQWRVFSKHLYALVKTLKSEQLHRVLLLDHVVSEDSGQKTPRHLCPMRAEFRQDLKM